MAKFNPPTTNFSFDKPGEGPDWKQRIVRFRIGTKLEKEDAAVQGSSLIYALWEGSRRTSPDSLHIPMMDIEIHLIGCLDSSMSNLCREGT